MNKPTKHQVIELHGKPAFVVVPYDQYIDLVRENTVQNSDMIPHEVVALTLSGKKSLARAWREHLGLTQAEVAARMGITQPALAQMETAAKPRVTTLRKFASVLGVSLGQLSRYTLER